MVFDPVAFAGGHGERPRLIVDEDLRLNGVLRSDAVEREAELAAGGREAEHGKRFADGLGRFHGDDVAVLKRCLRLRKFVVDKKLRG